MAIRLQVDPSATTGWTDRGSLVVSAAQWWAQTMPRGRGAVPRMLSRLLRKDRKQTFATKHGAKLAMAPRALDVYTAMGRKGRCWDPYVFETCRNLLKPGNVFYDLGASVGYMTIEMATVFNGQIKCVAFEPQPDLAHCIAVSASLNGLSDKVFVFETMVGDAPRQETLMLTSHSIHASVNAVESGGTPLTRQMITLDELTASGDAPPPDVIKMDIEGGELQALRGAQRIIRDNKPHIVLEINACADRFGYSRQDVIELLQGLADYEFFEIGRDFSLRPLEGDQRSDDVLARSVSRIK